MIKSLYAYDDALYGPICVKNNIDKTPFVNKNYLKMFPKIKEKLYDCWYIELANPKRVAML